MGFQRLFELREEVCGGQDEATAIPVVEGSEEAVKAHGLRPIAQVLSFADAAQDAIDFPTSPVLATPIALERGGCKIQDVDYFEVNEAFAVVPVAFNQLLGTKEEQMNVFGGSVALGHPIGTSGARIVTTLLNVLTQHNANLGLASICNGGGGASAILVQRLG